MEKKNFKKIEEKLPDSPGIYLFKKGKKILYVGKATSLRDRVRSYFSSDLMGARGPLIVKMVEEMSSIDFQGTNSVLEALILEAHTIKKFQPIYNSKEKDDKSYNFVVITDEEFPRVLIQRGRELAGGKNKEYGMRNKDSKLKADSYKLRAFFGPFPHGSQLKEALKIIRKIFPFRDKCIPNLKSQISNLKSAPKPCFNRQIELCPGVCTGEVSAKEYGKIINNLELFFSGETQKAIRNLERQMKNEVKSREFEKAQKIKQTIFAINHIQDVALLKSSLTANNYKLKASFRIEAYDIAHISGTSTVGVMVVMEGGELNKNEYRKFIIRGDGEVGVNDAGNLKEVLTRRFNHPDWRIPDLIVVDGGRAQINTAQKVLQEIDKKIPVVSVVKDEKHKPRAVLGSWKVLGNRTREILILNGEAHRFAIAFHKKKRSELFLTKKKK